MRARGLLAALAGLCWLAAAGGPGAPVGAERPKGSRYVARVPETLDLQERARLALRAMTASAEPASDYESIWWGADFGRNPPVMNRLIPLYGKLLEGSALLRMMTGSVEEQQIDDSWRRHLAQYLREKKPAMDGPEGGRQLAAVALNWFASGDETWKTMGEQAVDRTLAALRPWPAQKVTGWQATFQGWTLQGASQFYRLTGYQPAKELADLLASYLKNDAKILGPEGEFLARHDSAKGPALHFHHNANTLAALLDYALATGNRDYLRFAEKGYLWARSTGSPLVGFFPEYVNDWPDDRKVVDCEGCCVADMIIMALELTRAGAGDYWDDADRYLRNQFAEMQMLDTDWVSRVAAGKPRVPVKEGETSERMPGRLLGDFSGWSGANDFYVGLGPIQHCCLGNCSRALFYAWRSILDFSGGTLRVNLLLNRASQWADVNSEVPYRGRVDVRMKAAADLEIRIPEWVEPAQVRCAVNGRERALSWRGRYAVVGPVEPKDRVAMTLPIAERTVAETIGGVRYTLVIRGNDAVGIEPAGKYYPYYQREKYRAARTLWRTVTRFVPERAPGW